MDDFEQDTRAGRVYLGGYLETNKRGIPRHRYYPERSDDSNYCRAALARVLRSDRPVDRQLRDMLADLFEPIEPLKSPWGSRKLTAGFRNPVRPRDDNANTHMAWFVWKRASEEVGVEGAIQEAMDTFDVPRERMYDLWKAYKRLFEAIEGPMRRKGKG
jgi:hypothetical protein